MKQIFTHSIASLILGLSTLQALAVAPLPGLNLTEPIREPIPQGCVSKERAKQLAAGQTKSQELVSRGLLILVEFSDLPLADGNTKEAFDSLANADN